jgi:nucleoside-diphosphate-sugar epimerase
MGGRAILLTGGTGFIGSAVVRELLAQHAFSEQFELRVLTRSTLPRWMADGGVVAVPGDLAQPATMDGLGTGVATVLHLASQIGGEPAAIAEVNERGTGALLAEARRAGISRFLYLSTCAVYGDGVHRGSGESDLVPAPVSATSRTRLAAERMVLAEGGMVLRPHLVYGDGDRHVVPTLLRWIRSVPALADGGTGRTSLCAVRDLAAATVALATRDWEPGAVFHVNHPEPVAYRDLITAVCTVLDLPVPGLDLPVAEHRALTRVAMPGLSEHQYSLLTEDHWYASDRIWRVTGVAPGPGPAGRLAEAAPWYRLTTGAWSKSAPGSPAHGR